MPMLPSTGLALIACSSWEIFPFAFRVSTPFPFMIEMPAESYPRYSRRFRPSMSIDTLCFGPT
jgi:hypothetical protein